MFSSTPESIIPERITTKGHIEYQLRVFEGGLSVVYIEVKLQDGTGEEHLNAVAQLIAEADGLYLRLVYKEPVLTFIYISISTGCDYANSQLGFSTFPICGILCDGKSFEFYRFDSSTNPPTFYCCRYDSALPARYALSVANMSAHSTSDFIASLRPVCETISYILILGFITGIYA